MNTTRCQLCGRFVPDNLITQHHLTPKERGGKAEHRIDMCKACHKQVHAMFSNRDLEKLYPTIEQLRAAEPLQTFLGWIRKQKPDRTFRTIRSGANPRRKRN